MNHKLKSVAGFKRKARKGSANCAK